MKDHIEKGENEAGIVKHYEAFTPEEYRRILIMLEDYERRQWLFGLISKVAKWITTVGAAIVIGQQLWIKWIAK